MNGKELLINALIEKNGMSKKDATAAIETTLGTIVEETAKGKLSIPNFGNFELRERGARKGRNPQTGEEIQIAASKGVGFKPAKRFKDRL